MTGTGSAWSSASPRRPAASRPLVLLDTNALFLPVRVGFPLEAEVERLCPGATLSVPSSVLGELVRLLVRRTPDAAATRAIASRYRTVPAAGSGDDAVLRCAVRRGGWVVTADRAFRERLLAEGVTVLAPRDRHRLERFLPGKRGRSVRRGRSPRSA